MHKYAVTLFTKAFYWCLHKNLALSYGLTGKRTRKKLVSANILGSFGPTKKKFALVWFVYATLLSHGLTCRLQTFIKNLTSERGSDSDTRQRHT